MKRESNRKLKAETLRTKRSPQATKTSSLSTPKWTSDTPSGTETSDRRRRAVWRSGWLVSSCPPRVRALRRTRSPSAPWSPTSGA
uniref:Uncharacterized protein n=1 Tax=Gasterosteus aculeatus TaxID=69293 RepID=G3Q8F7_GASAC